MARHLPAIDLHDLKRLFARGTEARHPGVSLLKGESGDAASDALRVDLELVASLIEPGSRVLDLGCGNGELLAHLIRNKSARGVGVEISDEGVHACIQRGVPVCHGDIDQGLSDHRDQSFDYVVLSHTLQTIQRPRLVLQEMLRIGRQAIVSFPNFGYWAVRMRLLWSGRMPRTPLLPYFWYDTPNIHHCTLLDFHDLCQEMSMRVVRQIPLSMEGPPLITAIERLLVTTHVAPDNWLAPMAIFLLERDGAGGGTVR
jgi:methionine biosynthesis protein MetW